MEKKNDWREAVYREFSFLYTHGYTLSKATLTEAGAYAVFSSRQRQIAIRLDEANRVYVQIYKSRPLWSWLLDQPRAVSVFEIAKRHPAGEEIPVQLSGKDYASIFRKNAEFMQTHLADLIDGKTWLE
jgi:hypothetical protein